MNGTLYQPAPAILGHEGSGEVIAVGEGRPTSPSATTSSSPGPPLRRLRGLPAGEANLCVNIMSTSPVPPTSPGRHALIGFVGTGTFAEELVVPRQAVVKMAADVPYEIGALIGCGVTTGVGAALNTAKVRPGSNVVVFGAGGVGVAAIQEARIAGAAEIVAVDTMDAKLEDAKRFGATRGVKPDQLATPRRDERE